MSHTQAAIWWLYRLPAVADHPTLGWRNAFLNGREIRLAPSALEDVRRPRHGRRTSRRLLLCSRPVRTSAGIEGGDGNTRRGHMHGVPRRSGRQRATPDPKVILMPGRRDYAAELAQLAATAPDRQRALYRMLREQ